MFIPTPKNRFLSFSQQDFNLEERLLRHLQSDHKGLQPVNVTAELYLQELVQTCFLAVSANVRPHLHQQHVSLADILSAPSMATQKPEPPGELWQPSTQDMQQVMYRIVCRYPGCGNHIRKTALVPHSFQHGLNACEFMSPGSC